MQNRRARMTADNIIPQIVDSGRQLIESSLDIFRRVDAVVSGVCREKASDCLIRDISLSGKYSPISS